MKIYEVTIPITGYIYRTVTVPDDADDDEIFNAACETITKIEDIESFEPHMHICTGNVCYAEYNDLEKTLLFQDMEGA